MSSWFSQTYEDLENSMEHKNKQWRIKREPSSNDIPLWKRLWLWTGWRGKKLWDWQALLFIPVSIALIASLFTQWQNNRQQELENLRAERAMVETYLEHIGTLLLEEDLRTADENSDVRLLARARTLIILDGVSEDRKVRLLNFLSETKLIQSGFQGEPPVISLKFADLSGSRLVSRKILSNTDLDRADLIGANLANAELINTELPRADLSGADLSGAKGVRCEQTRGAESLDGATMPNGQKYEDWLKDREGCRE
jgi:Pentapeptide repeats (8 copies)